MIYSIALYLYALAVVLVSPFRKKAWLMVKGQWNTFRILRKNIRREEMYVWFHAASLGEFEQGRPLMERLRREHPEYKILLTFFSPSGYEVRKDYEGADVVCYLPFDTPGNVRSFLRLARPRMAFFIKYEFWNNYLHACRRRQIPVYSVSSIFRENQVFFRWYGRSYSDVLRCVTHFFVQNEVSRELLARKGVTNVTVAGDTRFDRVLDICRQAKDLPLVKAFKQDAKVLVAGSSWAPDEDLIIPYFNAHPEMKLVLAPHVVSEDHLKEIEGKLRRPFVRYSRVTEESAARADCLIIDGYGLLSSIYRYGEMAYVGGGFGVGIHNVPEAAVYGVPVLIGPNNRKFREAQDLLREGGCLEVTDADTFGRTMDRLLSDGKFLAERGRIAGQYIERNAGASDLIFDSVKF
ncbi:3-deoxy-D-manno-octulosonic acid transferase [Paraprevotella clara]|uniref:3-deoxy-D-manno-octulosonic acid transferase n=1 Tax=Paraprevotella clara TaxID=454154 RepID=UPI00266EB8D8|nr:glycosyltransferase N-terminal domain-containing protein [Paraprevotella clara]